MRFFDSDEEYISHLEQMLSHEESIQRLWRERASELEKERDAALSELKRTKTMLENAPTVDAMEVVRCKECRNARESNTQIGLKWCNRFSNIMRDFDFCSFGERRTDHGPAKDRPDAQVLRHL